MFDINASLAKLGLASIAFKATCLMIAALIPLGMSIAFVFAFHTYKPLELLSRFLPGGEGAARALILLELEQFALACVFITGSTLGLFLLSYPVFSKAHSKMMQRESLAKLDYQSIQGERKANLEAQALALSSKKPCSTKKRASRRL